MGEDPQDFITALDNGTFVRSIEDTLAAHDARFADLTEDQIADLPMTTRMLASLDSNDLRENVSLDLLEATIRKKYHSKIKSLFKTTTYKHVVYEI